MFLTVSDLTLTYFATPNLTLEGNPLVTELQAGWSELIITNVITYILYFVMAYYAYIKYKAPVSKETTDVKRYLADITYGDGDKATRGMWRWPKYWAPQIACLCYSVSTALPFARLILVFEWFLMLNHIYAPYFFKVVALFPLGRIDFFVAIIIAWGLSAKWIKKEFDINRKVVEKV